MGFLAKRTTKEMLQAREFPLGNWMADVASAIGGVGPGELLAAAVYRINIAGLIAKSQTYIGLPGEMNAIAASFSTVPSELSVLVLSDRSVQVTLGALGWRPGGSFRQAADWQIRLTVADDLTSVLMEFTDATTTDDALNNAKAFKAFCGALGDVLVSGIAVSPVSVSSAAELRQLVTAQQSVSADWVELRLSEQVPVSEGAFQGINWSLVNGWVSDGLRGALEAEGSWPLVVGDSGGRRTNVMTSAAARLLGEVVVLSYEQADDTAKDSLYELLMALHGATSIEVAGDQSTVGIGTSTRMLPVAVTANVSRLRFGAFVRMCAARCHVTVTKVSFKLRREKQDISLYAAPSRDKYSIVTGFHARLPPSALSPELPKGMLPQWSVDAAPSLQTDPVSTRLSVSGLTFPGQGALPASAQLLELLGSAVESLSGEESLQVWMLDRHSDYRSE